ncbi:MAG TPA: PspC domain-containing protein [Bacillota bacterium]|nr:PspC domain-containing protein [Bacillota bacterium]
MYKRLTRSNNERMVAGVLGGLANYFRIDPTIIRLGFVAFAICTAIFPMVIMYIIAAIIIPNESGVH